jgi:hypothetical protein
MADVCGLVLTALYNRLTDNSVGFNVQYAGVASSYTDLTDGALPALVFDFSPQSQNFAYGSVPPDLIEETSPFEYPILTLSADRGSAYPPGSGQRFHYAQFSGRVAFRIEVHLDWQDAQVRDFETWPNAVINSMYACLNAPSGSQPSVANNWGPGLVYSYDLSFGKGPVLLAGRNWRRTVAFTGTFEVNLL